MSDVNREFLTMRISQRKEREKYAHEYTFTFHELHKLPNPDITVCDIMHIVSGKVYGAAENAT